ncbi:MAG: hypothetical protein OXE59_08565 [Bacteroidetes bacterium]|nr:hypothetical protein [Bacteroidota bacterium]
MYGLFQKQITQVEHAQAAVKLKLIRLRKEIEQRLTDEGIKTIGSDAELREDLLNEDHLEYFAHRIAMVDASGFQMSVRQIYESVRLQDYSRKAISFKVVSYLSLIKEQVDETPVVNPITDDWVLAEVEYNPWLVWEEIKKKEHNKKVATNPILSREEVMELMRRIKNQRNGEMND